MFAVRRAVIATLAAGCSYCGPAQHLETPHTTERECSDPDLVSIGPDDLAELEFDDELIKQIQFYASRTLVLERQLQSGDAAVHEHRIVTRHGVDFEEVELPCLTPGVVVDVPTLVGDGDIERLRALRVSFEEGSSGLLYKGWKTTYSLWPTATLPDAYRIELDGNIYLTKFRPPDGSAEVPWIEMHQLLVSRSHLEDVKRNRRVLKGNRLP
jgi:hypothetical protein